MELLLFMGIKGGEGSQGLVEDGGNMCSFIKKINM
jgi:hypothetical protein